MNLFQDEMEQEAIGRIQRFARLAETMNFEVCVGFSGGKDSQVVYDLCKRSGIKFKAYFNRSFESNTTLTFIREHYPEVIWRRECKAGFIENIWKNKSGMLPDTRHAYCCEDYKHNRKFVDKCSVLGVRKSESAKRASCTVFSAKNKTTLKRNKQAVSEYFHENCQSIGTASVIQLLPIVDWTDKDIWDYIHRHNLPVNPEYKTFKRVGCIVCPKANFSSNGISLLKYPKLIDAFIKARIRGGKRIVWTITYDGIDYSDDKPYYICRWLNHSFMPFSKKQEELYKQVREKYNLICKVNLHVNN